MKLHTPNFGPPNLMINGSKTHFNFRSSTLRASPRRWDLLVVKKNSDWQ